MTADVIRLTIPAKPEYVSLCRLAMTGLSRLRELDEETVADLKLAITEAASNSIRHAYPGDAGSVEVVYNLRPDRLVIEVADEGAGFELERRARDDETGELSEGGLGIAIIRAVADELEFELGQNGRGSRLRFVKLLAD